METYSVLHPLMDNPQPHAGYPVMLPILALMLALALQLTGGDLWISDHLYQWQGDRWALRDAWWASSLLHSGGRTFSILCWMATLVAWVQCRRGRIGQAWNQPLAYLLIAVLCSTLLVSMLKHASGADCPWDLVRYGGNRPFALPFSTALADPARGACFPSGHASAGYAWMACWFALREAGSNWRGPALVLALLAGGTFGIAQQLRGAHFLSHDLVSSALCWLVATLLARIWFLRNRLAPYALPVVPARGASR